MTEYKELLSRAKEIDGAATPGPWMWDMRGATHQCYLVTAHSGQYYVMGFQRWGMQDALPIFQVYERYEGPMSERGSHGMVRADKLAKSYPGKEHHVGFDDYINHPDARYIAESRDLFHQMVEAITDLLARAEAAEAERDKAVELLGLSKGFVSLHEEIAHWRGRAERAEKKLAAAVFDLLRAEAAAEETAQILDDEVHPYCSYSSYLAIHDSVSDIVNWEQDNVWREQKA